MILNHISAHRKLQVWSHIPPEEIKLVKGSTAQNISDMYNVSNMYIPIYER